VTLAMWGAITGTLSLLWLVYTEVWRNPGRLRLTLWLAEFVDRQSGEPVPPPSGLVDTTGLKMVAAADASSACLVVQPRNVGRRPITVTSWAMKVDGLGGRRTLLDDLCAELADGKQVTLSVPASRVGEAGEMWLTDSAGKRWCVRGPGLRQILMAREVLPAGDLAEEGAHVPRAVRTTLTNLSPGGPSASGPVVTTAVPGDPPRTAP
jgi:hypothetical protein